MGVEVGEDQIPTTRPPARTRGCGSGRRQTKKSSRMAVNDGDLPGHNPTKNHLKQIQEIPRFNCNHMGPMGSSPKITWFHSPNLPPPTSSRHWTSSSLQVRYLDPPKHQEFQVPQMQARKNLISGYFWGWVFPYISRIHTAFIGEYLHFGYLNFFLVTNLIFVQQQSQGNLSFFVW